MRDGGLQTVDCRDNDCFETFFVHRHLDGDVWRLEPVLVRATQAGFLSRETARVVLDGADGTKDLEEIGEDGNEAR